MTAGLETLRLQPTPDSQITADIVQGDAPSLVYLHGLSSLRFGDKSDRLMRRAQKRGLGFARFDFRGHGESGGALHETTLSELIEDGLCVIRHMGPSILVGSSLGGLVAAWVAARDTDDLVRGAMLLCPALGFLPQMAQGAVENTEYRITNSAGDEFVFARRAMQDALFYDENTLPSQMHVPTLIVHGDQDQTVPHQLSQRLHDNIPHSNKSLWLMAGGDHALNGPIEQIYDRMEQFFLDGQHGG